MPQKRHVETLVTGSKSQMCYATSMKNSRALLTRKETWLFFLFGFSSGLPYLLVFSTLAAWMHEAGIDLKTIGWVSLVGLAYGFKFIWAPIVDAVQLPVLARRFGHRRSWLLVSQTGLCLSILTLSALTPNPITQTTISKTFVISALLIAIFSATQDIVIDALRIEIAETELQAWLAGTYVAGYRVGMIASGAGALFLASYFAPSDAAYSLEGWQYTYRTMAALVVVGGFATWLTPRCADTTEEGATLSKKRLFTSFAAGIFTFFAVYTSLEKLSLSFLPGSNELKLHYPLIFNFLFGTLQILISAVAAFLCGWMVCSNSPETKVQFRQTFVHPFSDLFQRFGRSALLIFLVILTYRMTDILMSVIATPFYLGLGFTKVEIASVTKLFGLLVTLLGGFFGGWLTKEKGLLFGLLIGGFLSALTNVTFAWLAGIGHEIYALFIAIGVDNFAAGIASAAFVAFLSALTKREFSATQYASLFALTALGPKFIAANSGTWATALGFESFFLTTAALGLPTLFFLWRLSKKHQSLFQRSQ